MVPTTTFPQLIGFDGVDCVNPDSGADGILGAEKAPDVWGV